MLLELQALELLRCVAQAEEFLHQCVGVNGLAHLGRIVPEGKQHPHDCVHKDRLREFQQLVFFHGFKRSGLDILDIADFLTLLQFKVHLDFTKFPFEAAAGSVRLYNNRQLQYALRHLMLLHKLRIELRAGDDGKEGAPELFSHQKTRPTSNRDPHRNLSTRVWWIYDSVIKIF